MSILEQIAVKIIKEQELIIGPLAWAQAGKVPGLQILDQKTGSVLIQSSNGAATIDQLVDKYENLFGRASKEVCRDAAAPFIADLSASEIPSSLR